VPFHGIGGQAGRLADKLPAPRCRGKLSLSLQERGTLKVAHARSPTLTGRATGDTRMLCTHTRGVNGQTLAVSVAWMR
jgi:hypothetical protein